MPYLSTHKKGLDMLTKARTVLTKQQKDRAMSYDQDPNLINVAKRTRYLERQIDELEWESGLDDPRLTALINELEHYRKLEEEGQLYEPKF